VNRLHRNPDALAALAEHVELIGESLLSSHLWLVW